MSQAAELRQLRAALRCTCGTPDMAECGTCGFKWCDQCFPCPSARSPCEHAHAAPKPPRTTTDRLTALEAAARALLRAEGTTISIPRRERVCTYCSGKTDHAANPGCPVHLARLALRSTTRRNPT